MKLKWRTFDYSWGSGEKMIRDLKNRIPNILKDAKLPNKKKSVGSLMEWLDKHVISENNKTAHSGALGIYIFSSKVK
jgi:hypothetical protein